MKTLFLGITGYPRVGKTLSAKILGILFPGAMLIETHKIITEKLGESLQAVVFKGYHN